MDFVTIFGIDMRKTFKNVTQSYTNAKSMEFVTILFGITMKNTL